MGSKKGPGNSVKVAVPQNTVITQYNFYYLDGFFGMAMQSVTTETGETSSVILNIEPGEYETSQIYTAEAFTKGSKIYWDTGNTRLTTTPTAIFIGFVTVAKDSGNVIWFMLYQGFVPNDLLAVIGTMANLTTTQKGTVVGAVNEIDAAVGDLTTLDTTEKGSAVGAINEVNTNADALIAYLLNRVQTGCLVFAPTTGSTHADGGSFDFNVNIIVGLVAVNGVLKEFTAQADVDIAHDTTSPIDDTDTDIIYTIVAKEATGTVSLQSVAGAAAASGSVAAPTDEAITTAVGHSRWIKIGQTQLHRSGASACTQTYKNDVQPVFSIS